MAGYGIQVMDNGNNKVLDLSTHNYITRNIVEFGFNPVLAKSQDIIYYPYVASEWPGVVSPGQEDAYQATLFKIHDIVFYDNTEYSSWVTAQAVLWPINAYLKVGRRESDGVLVIKYIPYYVLMAYTYYTYKTTTSFGIKLKVDKPKIIVGTVSKYA